MKYAESFRIRQRDVQEGTASLANKIGHLNKLIQIVHIYLPNYGRNTSGRIKDGTSGVRKISIMGMRTLSAFTPEMSIQKFCF